MIKVIKVTKNIQCNHIKEPYEILYSIEYYTFEDYFSVMIYEQIEKDIDKFLKNSGNYKFCLLNCKHSLINGGEPIYYNYLNEFWKFRLKYNEDVEVQFNEIKEIINVI